MKDLPTVTPASLKATLAESKDIIMMGELRGGTQKAASLTVDGVAMPEGVYGPGHATLGSHFTGTGRLRVGKLGGCLIIR